MSVAGRVQALVKLPSLTFALVLSLPFGGSIAFGQDADQDGVFDSADAAPCNPTVSALAFAPAEGTFGSLLFEDMWPRQGDLDFNDLVLAYNYTYRLDANGGVVSLRILFQPLAVGGSLDNGLGLHLPVPAALVAGVTRTVGAAPAEDLAVSSVDQEATFVISDNLRELFGGLSGPVNSIPSMSVQDGSIVVIEVGFSSPVNISASSTPHDVFMFRSGDPSHEIHLPSFRGTSLMNRSLFGAHDDGSSSSKAFVDRDGLPFALNFPVIVPYPAEGTEIAWLFPEIAAFAASGGATHQHFYESNVQVRHAYPAVTPLFPAPTVENETCLTCSTLAFDGVDDYVGVPDDPRLNLGEDAFTIEFFVRLLSDPPVPGGVQFIGHDTGGGPQPKWIIFYGGTPQDPGGLRLAFLVDGAQFSGGVHYFEYAANLVIGRWYHVAVVREGSEVRLFVDGRFISSGLIAGPIPDPSAPLTFGWYEGPLNFMNGNLADIRISRVARYAADFTPPVVAVADADTIGLWHLDEGGGTIATDSSNQRMDGVLHGAHWESGVCR